MLKIPVSRIRGKSLTKVSHKFVPLSPFWYATWTEAGLKIKRSAHFSWIRFQHYSLWDCLWSSQSELRSELESTKSRQSISLFPDGQSGQEGDLTWSMILVRRNPSNFKIPFLDTVDAIQKKSVQDKIFREIIPSSKWWSLLLHHFRK